MAPRTALVHDARPIDASALVGARSILILGRAAQLRAARLAERLGLPEALVDAMLERARPTDGAVLQTSFYGRQKLLIGLLPESCSRHNSPTRAWAVPPLARAAEGDTVVLLCLDKPEYAPALSRAVARSLPLYDATTTRHDPRTVRLFVEHQGEPTGAGLQAGMDAVRFAGRLVDTPTNALHTTAFVAEARAVAERTGAELTVIDGEALQTAGFGGLWAVGKAAVHGPALVSLRHQPEGATREVAWVGKGIVYDTGGLSIKDKLGMVGMKGDMGGAAAVLAAFEAAVALGVDYTITAVLCLAENAVGPDAVRPDDIIRMYSGKTVEINNTDAEGRLVLADGLAWVCEAHNPDLVIDLATLTGAALVATGKLHAAIVSNDEDLERAAVEAGLASGEPVFPILFAPELLRKEFRSTVADMRNSVKDRNNAQSSCAAQFIHNHLPEPAPPWLHIDLAGPAHDADSRGTGFGVGLLLAIGAGPQEPGSALSRRA